MCSDQSLRWDNRELVTARQRVTTTKGTSCVNGLFQPQGTVHLQDSAEEGWVSQKNPDLGSQGRSAGAPVAVQRLLTDQGFTVLRAALVLLASSEKGSSYAELK